MSLQLDQFGRKFERDVEIDTNLYELRSFFLRRLGHPRHVDATGECLLWGEDSDALEHVYSDRLNQRNDDRDTMASQLASEQFRPKTANWFELYLSASLLCPITLHSILGGLNGRGQPYQHFGYERNNDPAAHEALDALIRAYAERAQIGYDILTAEVHPRSVRTVPLTAEVDHRSVRTAPLTAEVDHRSVRTAPTDYIEYATGTDAAPSKTVEMIQQGPTEEWSPRRKFLAAIATILALPFDSKQR